MSNLIGMSSNPATSGANKLYTVKIHIAPILNTSGAP